MSMLECPDDFHRENRSFSALKKNQFGQLIDASFWPFFTFNMDRRTDQPAYFPMEMQFYISAMFVGFPDEMREEKPSFLDFENNWL